jgi:hypothetical protein
MTIALRARLPLTGAPIQRKKRRPAKHTTTVTWPRHNQKKIET